MMKALLVHVLVHPNLRPETGQVPLHPAPRGDPGQGTDRPGGDPPPDLAIEVDATSATRHEDYEPLGVAELWIYREDSLGIHVFDGRHYRETPQSPTFPGLPVRQWIPEYVRRAWQAGSSVALREFERTLRDQPRVNP